MRDPRTDPRVGDWLTDADLLIRVDRVADGEVIVAGFPRSGPPQTGSALLSEWPDLVGGASVVVLGDDDPMQARTVLEP